MKIARSVTAYFLLSFACACGQTVILSASPKDPDVKPEQRTATIVHYEKMRTSARATVRVLVLALRNTEGGQTARLNEAIDNEQGIVDWANWCILALRDKTDEARACVFQPDPKQ
jgi:hypothetical protein